MDLPPKPARSFPELELGTPELALDLLLLMLAFDPVNRPSAEGALRHNYFAGLPPVPPHPIPSEACWHAPHDHANSSDPDAVRRLI